MERRRADKQLQVSIMCTEDVQRAIEAATISITEDLLWPLIEEHKLTMGTNHDKQDVTFIRIPDDLAYANITVRPDFEDLRFYVTEFKIVRHYRPIEKHFAEYRQ